MSGQIEALEGLLARVQHNRQQPRDAASAAPPSLVPEFIESLPPITSAAPSAPPFAPAMHEPPAVVVPAFAPMPSVPSFLPAASSRPPPPGFEPMVSSKITATQRLSLPPAAPTAGTPAQGVVIAAPVPSAPTRPIAVAVSPAAPRRAATFGDLLWRSLALRPR